ncbi:DUF4292 domain-containing protein [Myroides pelagicus]|uniref:DUF4292 domain-containing protein n=1 Tax=Myroides pelagicus TaxID=270914 RepID=A0A7K1GKP6_9FLAO|nr:DUF4292 domain-containing protein [Myroides pelagicus]MEC4113211.1 DUF4292 domain-containing protein [Myroides pelagicus]MTH29378.1 DUF4292 domain-containing protein [Myroides pelagicus]
MKKYITLFCCLTLLVGCKKDKTAFNLTEGSASTSKTAITILNEHNKNIADFKTAIIRSSATYDSDKQSQKFSIDIAIERNKQIVVNIKYIGFPIVKALITPGQIQYYDKWNKEYFNGNYEVLSKWLGTDLDFYRFQNLLLGQAMDNETNNNKLLVSITEGLHKLESTTETDIQSAYYFEDKNALLKKEEITEATGNRRVTISYPNYQKIGKYTTPTEINIKAEQEKSINLNIRYDKVSFNEEANFNYKVPNGYNEISLKN